MFNQKTRNVDVTTFVAFWCVSKLAFGNVVLYKFVYSNIRYFVYQIEVFKYSSKSRDSSELDFSIKQVRVFQKMYSHLLI